MDTRFIIILPLELEFLRNIDFKAAILDSENAKPLASSHPGKIPSIPLELIKNAKKRLLPNIARFHACASELWLFMLNCKYGSPVEIIVFHVQYFFSA